MTVNEHSAEWIRLFLEPIPKQQTDAEVAFLLRQLPVAEFPNVLDVCCGTGRHAALLSRAGMRITGIDRNVDVLAQARSVGATVIAADAADLDFLDTAWDAVICMWQSFGWLSAEGNRSMLASMAARLRPGGRLVLDIYNRDFFDAHARERTHERAGIRITDRKRMEGNRLITQLEYSNGASDVFDWQLFQPAEIVEIAAGAGLTARTGCTLFDEKIRPSVSEPRMQWVFDRPSTKRRTGGRGVD